MKCVSSGVGLICGTCSTYQMMNYGGYTQITNGIRYEGSGRSIDKK